ncbi:monocarboxylate transporter 7 isoform X2 [Anabrus simplex]|uniref:monocarboxylate transporter 7 isoform X2 n=1 Tax=Anabrus simplex TaxID=316456 RepID=UPI0035A3B733
MAPAAERANGTRQRGLQLDNVVGSQPELGPAPPDGGYGWIIVIGVVLLRLTLPSLLLVSYGIFIMKANEAREPVQALLTMGQPLWNGVSLWVPVLFSAIWSFTDPWSRTLAAITSIRFTAICGVLLTSVGLIATRFVIKLQDPTRFYLCCLTSGFMAGVGGSLATTPADYLLTRYFRLRLSVVQSIVRIGQAVGYCIMPLITCLLLLHYGFPTTLLIQAAIVLQGLLGAASFRKPIYLQPQQEGLTYTLLQNEEDNCTPSKHEPQPESHHLPQPEEEQKEEGSDSPQPFYDSMPRPLFSDVELAASGHDVAFFIEDPTDEDVVLYVYGDHLQRRVKYTEELKMLYRPMFYAALLLLAATRITNITFWLLLPSLARSRMSDMQMDEAAGLMSAAGVMDVLVAGAGHWLLSTSPLAKKRLTSMSCFLAAGGLYGKDYSFSFWILSWVQIAAGTVWGMQPIIGMLCMKRTGR